MCRPRKSRSHPKERIKFIKKGFGAFNTPTTQPYKKKKKKKKVSCDYYYLLFFHFAHYFTVKERRPTDNQEKKNRRRINPPTTSVVLYYPVSRSEMQRYPNIQQFLKGRREKKIPVKEKRKKLASFIVLVLARYHI